MVEVHLRQAHSGWNSATWFDTGRCREFAAVMEGTTMSYKTILVHLDASRRCAERSALAARWARTHDGHLIGLVPTGLYEGVIPADAIVAGASELIAQSAEYLRQRAERIGREFRAQIGDAGVSSYELRVVDGAAVDAVVRLGRISDLVVLGQHDGEDDSGEAVPVDLPQRVLLELGRPVLVLPYVGSFEAPPTKVLVAWDGSREAAVAMRTALPALQCASRVTLLSCRRPQRSADRLDLLVPEALQYLQRHGVAAHAEDSVSDVAVADALLSRISDLDIDLLVMGGYGHSRLRELMLGGATRKILSCMTVPVLMAH